MDTRALSTLIYRSDGFLSSPLNQIVTRSGFRADGAVV
jgi:hypothetical protein